MNIFIPEICQNGQRYQRFQLFCSNLAVIVTRALEIFKIHFLALNQQCTFRIKSEGQLLSYFHGKIIKSWGEVGGRHIFLNWKFGV